MLLNLNNEQDRPEGFHEEERYIEKKSQIVQKR